jgi:hypothetical protein
VKRSCNACAKPATTSVLCRRRLPFSVVAPACPSSDIGRAVEHNGRSSSAVNGSKSDSAAHDNTGYRRWALRLLDCQHESKKLQH